MPDLSLEYCHSYWSKHSDPMLYRALCFMESVEDWTLDDAEEIEYLFSNFGDSLENIDNIDLKNADEFIYAAAYVKATRKLMLLQTLNEAYPGAVAKLIKHAEINTGNGPQYKLFLERHVLFERLRLLGNIFSEDASSTIKEVLESM